MTRRLTITQSEVATWLDCEMRAALRYEHRLGRPEAPVGARHVGSAMHEALRAAYATWAEMGSSAPEGTVFHAALNEANLRLDAVRDEALDTLDLFEGGEELADQVRAEHEGAVAGLALYLDEVFARDVHAYYPLAVEQAFRVPVVTDAGHDRYLVTLEGVFDLVLQRRADRALVVRDHKTVTGAADTYDVRFGLDLQLPAYLYALGQLFPGARATCAQFVAVSQSPPSVPKTILDGTVSVAKIATTRQAYEAACEAQSEPEWLAKGRAAGGAKADAAEQRWRELREKQRRLAEGLPTTLARWIAVHEHEYDPRDVEAVRGTLHEVANRVRLVRRGELTPQRNPRSCAILSCAFASPCGMGRGVEEVVALALDGGDFAQGETRHREVADAGAPWEPGKAGALPALR
ncbi:MAG: PD-(D/E)XK nuclease family protein [Sandaracinus sp.]|nr:PD-(D/E)XK nuclease family protein [Sandaracinus sp.]MCB9620459.1 PD-(D/E)XK nuclease family protein [Sandaracinus sp.]MCB9624685.1 PD-(D/E)XK nuclease family protein [Sandaracinus sp.]MCB9635681.1 PD-(D/E)XK nuclease family protein [Sandaracinus sp.]